MSFGENLKKLMAEKNMTAEQIASRMGVSRGTVTHWSNSIRFPKSDELIYSLASVLGVAEQELFDPNNKRYIQQMNNDNVILLDKLDMRAGAGASGFLDVPREGNKIAVDKLVINGLNPKYLKAIEVIGDSMEPDFQEGDIAILDMVFERCDFVKINGTYIVRVGDVVHIKRVEFLPEDKVRLISVNKAYGDMLPHKDGYEYEIIGKVCGKIHIGKGLTFDYQGIR